MPELPEVETTRRGIDRLVKGQTVATVIVRNPRLRRRVPLSLARELPGQRITTVGRRAKYLLLGTPGGTLIIHLGMSGSLRIVAAATPPEKHDHVDIVLGNGRCLRFADPRRFGLLLWTRQDPLRHPLLRQLGPEPLDCGTAFDGDYLYQLSRGRRVAIKPWIMSARVVVGVGNIYASEALFRAGIHPLRAAGRLSCRRYHLLVENIRRVLTEAIAAGGTTLRDFQHGEGRPGYFRQRLQVYGRARQPCLHCGAPVREIRQGQRTTYYCSHCQH